MAIFQSDDELYQILHVVFERLADIPGATDIFTQSNLVIRMRLTEPHSEILLDGRQPPLEIFCGPRPGAANIEFELDADLLHYIWLGKESISQAFFKGRIKTKGNPLKAPQFIELFKACDQVYTEIVSEFGLPV